MENFDKNCIPGRSRFVSSLKGDYFCVTVYGDNAFWANGFFLFFCLFLLQYLEWPLGKQAPRHFASLLD